MGEFVSVLPLEGIGVVGILLVVMGLLASGRLVVGTVHKEALAERDARISYLQSALRAEQEISATNAATISEWKVTGELTAHLMEAIRANQASAQGGAA